MAVSTDFELLGHALPPKVMPCQEYLGNRRGCERGDLSLLRVVEALNVSDYEAVQEEQANRLRWLAKFMHTEPAALYGSWLHEDIILDEATVHVGLPPETFQAESQALGLFMLRRELKQIPYYLQIRHVLAARVWHNDNVLVFGPTAGGEVEMAEDVGGFPFLCNGFGRHVDMCHERLLHDRVVFEPITMEELERRPMDVHFIILTPYLVHPKVAVRTAYNLLGLYGWMLCPSDCAAMVEEMERLGMVRRGTEHRSASLFFKYLGLPENAGADE